MNFNEYQHAIRKTWGYPDAGNNLVYPALGLAGEAGEAADKIKKYWRNYGTMSASNLTDDQVHQLVLEIGDVLWYIAALGIELGVPLDAIAQHNLDKTYSRSERGVVKGEGDNR